MGFDRTSAGYINTKQANVLSDAALSKLVSAGAYSRTIDRLVSNHCGILGLSAPLTEEDIMRMTTKEINTIISHRYA